MSIWEESISLNALFKYVVCGLLFKHLGKKSGRYNAVITIIFLGLLLKWQRDWLLLMHEETMVSSLHHHSLSSRTWEWLLLALKSYCIHQNAEGYLGSTVRVLNTNFLVVSQPGKTIAQSLSHINTLHESTKDQETGLIRHYGKDSWRESV